MGNLGHLTSVGLQCYPEVTRACICDVLMHLTCHNAIKKCIFCYYLCKCVKVHTTDTFFSTLFSSFKSSLINIIIKPSLLNSILIAELVLLWFFLAISVSVTITVLFNACVCVCGGGGVKGGGGLVTFICLSYHFSRFCVITYIAHCACSL